MGRTASVGAAGSGPGARSSHPGEVDGEIRADDEEAQDEGDEARVEHVRRAAAPGEFLLGRRNLIVGLAEAERRPSPVSGGPSSHAGFGSPASGATRGRRTRIAVALVGIAV